MKNLLLLPMFFAAFGASAACKPVVSDAVLRVAPGGMGMAAGYFRIDNPCSSAVVLNRAASPAFRSVSIHQTVSVDGVSRMRALPSMTLARGDRALFAPGGLHIMFMQASRALPPVGSRVPVTLSGPGWSVTTSFVVRSATSP